MINSNSILVDRFKCKCLDFSLPLLPFVIALSDSLVHPPLYHVLTSLLTRSSHLSLGHPRLLLPSSRISAALFGSLSSAIVSMCPAHCSQISLLLTSLSIKLLWTPISSLNSTILLLSALFTLAIFRTQLSSPTCSLCCCISASAKVSVPYRHAGVTQVLMTLPFSLFEICRCAITPSTALHTFALACTLRRTPLAPSSCLRTLPLLGT